MPFRPFPKQIRPKDTIVHCNSTRRSQSAQSPARTSNTRNLCLHFGLSDIGKVFVALNLNEEDVVLADIAPPSILALREKKSYSIMLHEGENRYKKQINIKDAVYANSRECIDYMTHCALLTTSVRRSILPRIAPTILRGLKNRWAFNPTSLMYIICCESDDNLSRALKRMIGNMHMTSELHAWIDKHVYFVDCRFVTVILPNDQDDVLHVDSFKEWVLDMNSVSVNDPLFKNLGSVVLSDDFELYRVRDSVFGPTLKSILYCLGRYNEYNYEYEVIQNHETEQLLLEMINEMQNFLVIKYRWTHSELYIEALWRGICRNNNRLNLDSSGELLSAVSQIVEALAEPLTYMLSQNIDATSTTYLVALSCCQILSLAPMEGSEGLENTNEEAITTLLYSRFANDMAHSMLNLIHDIKT